MNLMAELLSHPAGRRVGWALVHFVWQGAAVAMLLAVGLALLRNRSPQARWIACCAALGLMAVLPVVTAAVVSVDGPPARAAAEAPAALPSDNADAGGPAMTPSRGTAPRSAPPLAEDTMAAAPPQAPAGPAAAPPPAAPWAQRARQALQPILPWAVLAWAVGVAGLSVWHLGGWVLLARARRGGIPLDVAGLREAFEALRGRLGVRRAVRLLESARVAVPAVVGWLAPVVLLPVGAMTGLTPRQLEMVLAHELAHVRRCDGLVRLLQAAVETLLFYHPAVWWVSARIRTESEHCCDELAVAVTGDRPGYARALARVAELGRRRPHLAAAATGGRLLPRIRRILGLAETPARSAATWITGAVLLTALAAAGLIIYGCATNASPTAAQPAVKWGGAVGGLRCGLATAKAEVPMGSKVDFLLHLEFDPKTADPKVDVLDRTRPHVFNVTLTFTDTKTGKTFQRPAFDIGMPAPQVRVPLDKPLEPEKVEVYLLNDAGEQVPAGAYSVTATCDVDPSRVRVEPTPKGVAWSGKIVSGPLPLTVTPVEPRTVEVKLPTALRFPATENGLLAWGLSDKDPATVSLRVRPGFSLVYRLNAHLFLNEKPLTPGDGLLQEGGCETLLRPDRGTWPFKAEINNGVVAGGKLKVVADLEIIENSAPGMHGWAPVGPVVRKVHLEGVATKHTVPGLARQPEETWGQPAGGLRTRLGIAGGLGEPMALADLELFLFVRNVSDKRIALDRVGPLKDPWQLLRVRKDGKADVPIRKSSVPEVESQGLDPGGLTELSTVRLAAITDLKAGLYTLQWSLPADRAPAGKAIPPASNVLYLKVALGKGGKLIATEQPAPEAAAPATQAADPFLTLVREAIEMKPQTRIVSGQRPTGLDFRPMLARTAQDKDLTDFPKDREKQKEAIAGFVKGGKAWALAALLDHEDIDVKIGAAKAIDSLRRPESVAALLAAAKANNFAGRGSESATLHSVYRACLKAAIRNITTLQATPKGLIREGHRRSGDPVSAEKTLVLSDFAPEQFPEEVDFAQVEAWLTEKYLSEVRTQPASAPATQPAGELSPKERGLQRAAGDIKAGKVRILYYGKPWSAQKPLVDEASGLKVEIVEGCVVTPDFVAETDAYNAAMRDWARRNAPALAPPAASARAPSTAPTTSGPSTRGAARLTREQQDARDKALVQAAQRIREGLGELAKTFPQLAVAANRPLEEALKAHREEREEPGRLSLFLGRSNKPSKAPWKPEAIPDVQTWSLLAALRPMGGRVTAMAMFPKYPALGLEGQCHGMAGDPKLDAALKKLLAEALAPLRDLNEQAGKPAPATQPAGEWGPANGGVKARLRADKWTWASGQTPTFRADIRNTGRGTYSVAQAQQLCELILDGTGYRWVGEIDVKSSALPAGREYKDIPVALTDKWRTKDGDKPLKLAPGRHSIRVTFFCDGGSSHENLVVQTNAVAFEVAPPGVRVSELTFAALAFHGMGRPIRVQTAWRVVQQDYSTSPGFVTMKDGRAVFTGFIRDLTGGRVVLVPSVDLLNTPLADIPAGKQADIPREAILRIDEVLPASPPATQPATQPATATATRPAREQPVYLENGRTYHIDVPGGQLAVDTGDQIRGLPIRWRFRPAGARQDRPIGIAVDMAEIAQVLPSPDGKHLAVVSVGEGHPVLEVFDLPAVLAGKAPEASIYFDPYPGTIHLLSWRGRRLGVLSDMPLSHPRPNNKGRLPANLQMDDDRDYLLDPATGRFTDATADSATTSGPSTRPTTREVAERLRAIGEKMAKHAGESPPFPAPTTLPFVNPSSQPATKPAGSRLDFRIVPNPAGSSRKPVLPLFWSDTKEKFLPRALKELADKGPDAARKRGDPFRWFELAGEVNFPDAVIGKHGGRRYILLAAGAPHVMLAGPGKTAWGLAKAYVTPYGSDEQAVGFEFDESGAKRFAAFTKAHVGSAVAILVDGKVLSAPVLRTALGRRGLITGRFTDQQARDLVRALQAGMPAGLVNSEVLQTAATKILADFVAYAARKGRMPKAATQVEFLPKFIEGLKARYPRSVLTTPAEEKALAAGTFDDAGNARRLTAAAKRLQAAEAALPAMARFILTRQRAKALKGAKLEFARRLIEAIAEDVARPATRPATQPATAPGGFFQEGLAKALDLTPAQQAKVRAWFEARKDQGMPDPAELAGFLNSILDERQRPLLKGIIESGTIPPAPASAPAARR